LQTFRKVLWRLPLQGAGPRVAAGVAALQGQLRKCVGAAFVETVRTDIRHWKEVIKLTSFYIINQLMALKKDKIVLETSTINKFYHNKQH
jgi:hypothetical protein